MIMGFRTNQNRITIAAAMAGTLLVAIGSAHGGDDPLLLLEGSVDGDSFFEELSPTSANGNLFTYAQDLNGSNYEINWSMFVDNDLNAGVLDGYQILNSTLSYLNTGTTTSSVSFALNFPVGLEGLALNYGGSISGALTGGEFGGQLSNLDDNVLWEAGNGLDSVASLYDDFSFVTTPFQTVDIPNEAFGVPIPSLPGTGGNAMQVLLNFEVSAGSSVVLTSTYIAQIPAPGAAITLGLGLLVPRRRRKA
jgi:hypothetical protein